MFSQTGFTVVQTQIKQNCQIHTYTTGITVTVLARILRLQEEHSVSASVSRSDIIIGPWY